MTEFAVEEINHTNGMENANEFSIPQHVLQRVHILLQEKPQTRKCDVDAGIKRGNVSSAFRRGSLGKLIIFAIISLILACNCSSRYISGICGVRGGGSMRYVPDGKRDRVVPRMWTRQIRDHWPMLLVYMALINPV